MLARVVYVDTVTKADSAVPATFALVSACCSAVFYCACVSLGAVGAREHRRRSPAETVGRTLRRTRGRAGIDGSSSTRNPALFSAHQCGRHLADRCQRIYPRGVPRGTQGAGGFSICVPQVRKGTQTSRLATRHQPTLLEGTVSSTLAPHGRWDIPAWSPLPVLSRLPQLQSAGMWIALSRRRWRCSNLNATTPRGGHQSVLRVLTEALMA